MYVHNTWGEFIVESRRTDRKAAEQDIDMLKLFGKKAWIAEVE
jgi:hypothetical protein